jgi:hypothetical protein
MGRANSACHLEGQEGATFVEMGADGLGDAGTTGVTGAGELDFMLICSFSLTSSGCISEDTSI